MRKVTSLILATALVPAMAMGVASVSAEETGQAMDQQQGGDFMTNKPQGAVSADDLMGSEIRNRENDQEIGSVKDLIIDEEGKVTAVVVGTGQFMGMGGGDVAISWDKVEQERDGEDDVSLFVDMTEEELEQAPEYDQDDGGFIN